MPPIKCTPCRLEINGKRYRIYSDGSVSDSLTLAQVGELGLGSVREVLDYEAANLTRLDPHSQEAKVIRHEASRRRRNRDARERNQARRDLGLKKTPYGWE